MKDRAVLIKVNINFFGQKHDCTIYFNHHSNHSDLHVVVPAQEVERTYICCFTLARKNAEKRRPSFRSLGMPRVSRRTLGHGTFSSRHAFGPRLNRTMPGAIASSYRLQLRIPTRLGARRTNSARVAFLRTVVCTISVKLDGLGNGSSLRVAAVD